MKDYGSYSLWLDDVRGDLTPRPSLAGEVDADVAIVGAGYTGLWTAYYLLETEPSLRVVLLEKEVAGFGASGRNGGWCSALFAASRDAIARRHGRAAAVALQHELFKTVDEVGRVAAAEQIDAAFHKGGTLTLVTARSQLERVKAIVDHERSWGFGEDDYRWLSAHEVRDRVVVEGALGAVYTPHCARIHPARLVRGLARAVERRNATIFERSEATAVEPGFVRTPAGTVTARWIVRATEGYTSILPGSKRQLLPLYSLMIATEPLPAETWRTIGWSNVETIHDGRHLLIYAQRTPDGRIAIGGRGAPYHYGSRVDDRFDREQRVFDELRHVLATLFPAVAGVRISHEWGGPLGVPRDWFSSVGVDRATGTAWAGGYVGDGVSTSNLAGRTLADLLLGRDSDLVRLPWVNRSSPRWEPEPLRWVGVNLALRLMASADRREQRTGKPTRRGERLKRMIGAH